MEYTEVTESFIPSGCYDTKGREIGYIVGLCDNGVDFRAYVQNARRVKGNWQDFGVRQRSKSFKSQNAATTWAFATAHNRITNIKSV